MCISHERFRDSTLIPYYNTTSHHGITLIIPMLIQFTVLLEYELLHSRISHDELLEYILNISHLRTRRF